MTVIIGIDPGETTGLALYESYDLVTRASMCLIECSAHRVEELIIEWSSRYPVTPIIWAVERFTVGADTLKKSRQPAAQHIFNIATNYVTAHREPADVLELNHPGPAKKIGTRQLRRQLGILKPGWRHAGDASSHVLLALARRRPGEFTWLLRSGMITGIFVDFDRDEEVAEEVDGVRRSLPGRKADRNSDVVG